MIWSRSLLTIAVVVLAGCANMPDQRPMRVATFNTSLYFDQAGGLVAALADGDHEPARKVAAIIQQVAPDVILLNEFDYDAAGVAIQLFQQRYLGQSQYGQPPVDYPHVFTAPVNTGVSSGVDLNGDGAIAAPHDAHGWGEFPGKYGMAVLSRYPIDRAQTRTFQNFLWRDLPSPSWPTDPATGEPFYAAPARAALRLSSKSHWDVSIQLADGQQLHLLAAHPTPPVFDGPEDRNGRRNHDEIRFWSYYLDGAEFIYDDAGQRGGLVDDAAFVIVGDLNADPFDGDGRHSAITQLLAHPRVNQAPAPSSVGGRNAAREQGGLNEAHGGDPANDTGDFGDQAVGNLRIDYALPSDNLNVLDAGVFWPIDGPAADWIRVSDHRLVWVDLAR